MKKALFICALLSLLSGEYLYSQCAVSTDCLHYDKTWYHCLEQPATGSFKLSDFISPNGPLPVGGGFVNVIIDGDLVVDVDYTFDASAHVLMTPGSSITVDDEIPGNLMGPKLVFKEHSTVSSCNGYWDFIRVTDPYASLEFKNAVVTQGGEGIWAFDGTAVSAITSMFIDFQSPAIRIGDEAGSDQNIKAYLVDNLFSTMPQGISIYNTNLVSIGSYNRIVFPANTSSFPAVGIVVVNSSVSVGENNVINDYPTGILANNHSGNTQFLNLRGVEIIDALRGINLLQNNIDGVSSEGFDLFVKSCSFKESGYGIRADALDGNTYKILDNEFINDNSFLYTAIQIAGGMPHEIEIKQNTFEDSSVGKSIQVELPFWNAGTNFQVAQNTFDISSRGIYLVLGSGGIISENIITLDNPGYKSGINVDLSDGLAIAYNDVTLVGGDSQGGSHAISIRNSNNCIVTCNTTQGNNIGRGLLFQEHCDNTIIARNTMNNHNRGLYVWSLNGDGVIGKQTYRDNRWYGGITAEAALEAQNGTVIDLFFVKYNQFLSTGQKLSN